MDGDRKSDGGKIGLGVFGAVALILCCDAPLLLLTAGGGVLAAIASYFGYAWILVPVLLVGLAIYVLRRR
ncbi:hypothetical protein RZ532_19015 [Nitratireductor aquimarinus]|uniref:hypothetical protein n=1 Tax=Nitratireductor aquimarinus TaxID=889300 RepID=UPI0029361A1B|nr:hypothetical protein [Nitratireductor aquimarinus]MDV2968089.1 hypothetical protein [Nitratireductor aquimarinus]